MSSYLESTKRVRYEGPQNAKILLVGESPGGEEVGQGKPFVGKSGQLLERYLNRLGVDRSQVRLANLCQFRPRGNNFSALIGSKELEEGLEELRAEVSDNNYNVIVALGGFPMYYLTGICGKNPKTKKPEPGSGIVTYRGSRLPSSPVFGSKSKKVICSYHPSFIANHMWKLNPVFFTDIQHAVEDSNFPELRYPEYETYIDPSASTCLSLVSEALSANWISLDIETFQGGRFSCIGSGWEDKDGKDKALCITYKSPHLFHYAKEIWESDTPKILQYGTYDISFMYHFYDWNIGGYYDRRGWDTYVASANILPDFPRGLDFLTSIYTRFPFYKEERKTWREVGDMNILWNYNMKDVIATKQIAYTQMGEMRELYG